MRKRQVMLRSLLATSLMLAPVSRAAADADGLVGGIVGGIIGGVIVNEANKNRQQRQVVTTRRTYSGNTYERQQNREIQTSLNYFGFPAGTPDGVLGRNSRSAISNYQAHMGYPPTGYLTEYERSFLVSSYQRAIAGGGYTNQLMAQHGGPRGLLIAFRDEAAGGAPAGAPAAVVAAAPATVVAATPAPAPAPAAPVVQAAAPETAAPAAPALPSFSVAQAAKSVASHCNKVSLVTTSNGGYTNVSNITDPRFALSEQFCLARTYAIADGEALASQVQGVTLAQMDQQCAGFVPLMREQLASLAVNPRDKVMQDIGRFVIGSGQSPAQLSSTARICLSSGYRTDNAELALASAMILVGVGEAPYAEILGHHLGNGFGTSERADLAQPWYGEAIQALENGATAVFAPGQGDRVQLLRAATGGAPSAAQPAVVPTFAVPQANN